MNIPIKIEGPRGCGHRKKGGLYLVADGDSLESCGRMPIPLKTCPTCGCGIKIARGFTWIDGDAMAAPVKARPCPKCDDDPAALLGACPLSGSSKVGKVGLIWVGSKFYRTPADYVREGISLGISRRVNFVPKGLKLNETWIFLAHISALPPDEPNGERIPGVFFMFRPKAVEVICDGTETEEEIAAYLKRGLSPVIVKPVGRDGEQLQLKSVRSEGEDE